MSRGLPALALIFVTACGHGARRPAPARDAGPVVAEVDGVPIHRAELESRMRADHLGAREALERLIDEELTVTAARHFGVRPDRDVAFTRKRAEVQLLLERQIDQRVGAEDVTDAEVRAAWEAASTREADHLLVKVGAGASVSVKARAHALAARVHEAASVTTTRDEFTALAVSLREPGLELVHEDLGSFQRDGRYVRAFEDQAFRLVRAGQISEPFETEFGWHVVRLRGLGNVFGASIDEARTTIVEGVLRGKRRAALEELLREIAARHRVEIDDSLLGLLGPRS